MLVLIATNEFQGVGTADAADTVEGELVTPLATECASGDRCGCRRGFPGLASGGTTTTAMIVDRPGVTEGDLREAVYDWLDRGGWIDLLEQHHDDIIDVEEIVEALIDEHVEMIGDVCASFPEGTVVMRRGVMISARSQPFAA